MFAIVLAITVGPALFRAAGDLLGHRSSDLANLYFYWRGFAASRILSGRFPAWSPHVLCGTPFAANPEAALFYPPNVVFLALPLPAALNLSLLFHIWLTGFSTWILARKLGCKNVPGLLAGLIFMLCGSNFARINAGHLSNINTVSWLPLLMAAVETALREPGWSSVRNGAVAGAMMVLAGQLQYCVFAGVFLAMYVLCRMGMFPSGILGARLPVVDGVRGPVWMEPRRELWLVARFVIMAMLACGLAGVQVSLTYGFLRESSRNQPTLEFARSFSLPPTNLDTLVLPQPMGPSMDGRYWGPLRYWEINAYIGLVPLLLVLHTLGAVWRRSARLESDAAGMAAVTPGPGPSAMEDLSCDSYALQIAMARSFAVAGAGALLLACGGHTPLFGLLFDWVPFVRYFRGWSKFLVEVSLSLAMLAAFGLHWLLGDPRELGRTSAVRLGTYGTGSLLLGLLACACSYWARVPRLHPASADPLAPHIAFQVIRATLGLGIGAALILTTQRHHTTRPCLSVVLLALVTLDLVQADQAYVATMQSSALESPAAIAAAADGARTDGRVYVKSHIISSNVALLGGFRSAFGVQSIYLDGMMGLLALAKDSEHIFTASGAPTFESPPLPAALAAIMAVRFVYTDAAMRPQPGGLPRVRILTRYRIVRGKAEAWNIIARDAWSPSRELLIGLEGQTAPAVESGSDLAPGTGTAVITTEDDRSITVRTSSPQPALLYLADSWTYGWSARVDGDPTPIYRANLAFRAVAIPSGVHQVSFEYSPPGLGLGLVATFFTACVLVAMW